MKVATFYRLVRSNPPSVEDFTSNCERGLRRRPERGETIEDWTGLSVFASLEAIRELLRRTALMDIETFNMVGSFRSRAAALRPSTRLGCPLAAAVSVR